MSRNHQAKAALDAHRHPSPRLRTLLSEGRKQERVALDMVGKLALGKPGVGMPLSARAARSDEGLQVRAKQLACNLAKQPRVVCAQS